MPPSLHLAYLDTNIFANVLERGADEAALRRALDRHQLTPAMSTAHLHEVCRDPEAGRRNLYVRTIYRIARHWLELHTFMEARDVRREIARCHPNWLRRRRPTAAIKNLLRFWPDYVRDVASGRRNADPYLGTLQKDDIESNRPRHQAIRQAKNRAGTLLTPTFEAAVPTLTMEIGATLPPSATLEAIQADISLFCSYADHFTRMLVYREYSAPLFDDDEPLHDLADFALPYLRRGMPASRDELARFCFLELDARRVPRTRLCAALNVLQSLRSWNTGNVGDRDHAMYLSEVAVFVTSDRALFEMLTWLPTAIERAPACLVKPDHSNLEHALSEALAAPRS